MFLSLLKPRDPDTHKGTYGHVLTIAGSKEMLGAGYLASLAALRAGAGLSTYALPKTSFAKFDSKYPEIIPIAIADEGKGCFCPSSIKDIEKTLKKKDAVVLGPGLGRQKETEKFLQQFLPKISGTLVIDADAIVLLAGHQNLLKKRKGTTVLTPHPGEMAMFLGSSTAEVQKNRLEVTKKLSRTLRCYVVLKGHHTVIGTPEGKIFINPTGNPGMATAGTGDVLAGFLGGLLAQGYPAEEAIVGGVYYHGLAGDLAKAKKGEKGMVASDVLDCLPEAFTRM